MTITALRQTMTALPLVAMLALAGCGGGGSGGTAMNTGGPTPPDTGGGPTMCPDGQTGTPPNCMPQTGGGLLPPATPPAPTLAELIPDSANTFGAVSKALLRDGSAVRTSVSDRFSISSVASDGDNGFHVTYVIDGTETTVHFEKTDFATQDRTSYTKDGKRRVTAHYVTVGGGDSSTSVTVGPTGRSARA